MKTSATHESKSPDAENASGRQRFDLYNNLALILVGVGLAGLLLKAESTSLAWFCIFAGSAVHYGNGIKHGELSSRFFGCNWHRTVRLAESPTMFYIAAAVEALWVLAFFFLFLFQI